MLYYAIIDLSHFMYIVLLDIDESTIICMIFGLIKKLNYKLLFHLTSYYDIKVCIKVFKLALGDYHPSNL
jgi:hypothetical protein